MGLLLRQKTKMEESVMIEVSEKMYEEIAALLLAEIGDKDYFNGTIEYDTDEFYSSLTCTLIICREPISLKILSILPVWWDYDIALCDGVQLNDFSWSELDRHLVNKKG